MRQIQRRQASRCGLPTIATPPPTSAGLCSCMPVSTMNEWLCVAWFGSRATSGTQRQRLHPRQPRQGTCRSARTAPNPQPGHRQLSPHAPSQRSVLGGNNCVCSIMSRHALCVGTFVSSQQQHACRRPAGRQRPACCLLTVLFAQREDGTWALSIEDQTRGAPMPPRRL